MKINNLQLDFTKIVARILDEVPSFRAWNRRAGVLVVAALCIFVILECGCDVPGCTESPMPSDPIPSADDSLFTGTWIVDGSYVQIVRAQGGFELRRKNGDSPQEKVMPFRLARLGDTMFFEFEIPSEDSLKRFHWPCRIDVVDKALQLYCFYLDDLKDKRPDVQLRMKEFEGNEQVIDASPEEIRDLYMQLAYDPFIFRPDMTMKRPQPDVVARMQRRADAGSADAQEQLARYYLDADYVAYDQSAAEKWLRRAADQGHAKAQYELGQLLLSASGPDQRDNEEILFWFRKASEQGHAPAFGAAGLMYEIGNGVPADPAHAINWYQAGEQQSDHVSHYRLGLMHLSGEWLQKDERQALEHFVAAASISPKTAAYWEEIAALRLRANDESVRNASFGLDAAQRAAALEPNRQRLELLAEAQFSNGQYLAAAKTYRLAMKEGHAAEEEEAMQKRLAQYESAVPFGMR